VFPDGGFPNGPPAPEGGLPGKGGKTPAGALAPPGSPTNAKYAPPDDALANQDAPGVLPDRLPDLYKEMLHEAASYTPGISPVPIADYAPAGYEARETDEGQAPGVAEFTPVPPPVPVTPEEREKFVTRGMVPGSYLVPGTNTSVRFRGFVRLTGLDDLNPIGSRDDFVTNTIPVPQQSGQNLNASARYSRIGLDTWTPTSIFEWNVHTFIEGDFFNGPAQAVGGGGNPFRLRFAFPDFGYFRVGQQNSVFMDGNAFPITVDFAGPRGLANLRRPGIRATMPLCDNFFWAVGIEQPFSDITTNGEGRPVQEVPDFATHLRYETDYGHVQLSSILRAIQFQPTEGDLASRVGWGLSASTVFHPWALLSGSNPVRKSNPTGLERSRVLLQYTFGWGIGRYIQDTAALGLDAQADPADGAFDTVFAMGWSASYEHWFNEKWLSNLTFSQVLVDSAPGQPGTTYASARYLAVSLWYVPIRNLSLGVEYVWGERQNLDDQLGSANRIDALVQYNF
jgi:hypothetical protein